MWQLSWPEPNEAAARAWNAGGPEALLAEAQRR